MSPEGLLKNDYILELEEYNRRTGQIYSGEQLMKNTKMVTPPKPIDPDLKVRNRSGMDSKIIV